MTDLTEQWKKGELPSGEYYIIDDLGLITTDKYFEGFGFGIEKPQSIIAPVPTFDEWKASYNCMLENEVLRLKNAQLKELLKECFEYIDWTDGTGSPISQQKLLDKIDEVMK